MITNKIDIARARAEALFRSNDAASALSPAMQEYRAATMSQQEKTRRLRAQRLSRQAASEDIQ